jgi:large subunit ribosomal protein L23
MGLLDRWTKKQAKEKLAESKGEAGAEAAQEKIEAAQELKPVAIPESASLHSLEVILRPLVTEKAAHQESAGKYSFIVGHDATKLQIKKAVKQLYGVEPMAVTVMNMGGKWKLFGRMQGRRQDVKKAIVTLPKGKTITIHEGV